MAYADNVFINCPFDPEFEYLRNAIVFAIFDCGFVARCALESANGHEYRFEKIKKLINDSKFGLHDISRTELDTVNSLPRFNMPLELGVFIGAVSFGSRQHKDKSILILDKDQYRYQMFMSDIAGQDIRAHDNCEKKVIGCVRDWLASESGRKNLPGGAHIARRYEEFREQLPGICRAAKIEPHELTYADYSNFVSEWAKREPLAQ